MKKETLTVTGISINTDLCEGCGDCIAVCLLNVFGWNKQTGKAKLVNPDVCTFCAECIRYCIASAIRIVDLPGPEQETQAD